MPHARRDSRPLAGGTTRRDSGGRWYNAASGVGTEADRASRTAFLPPAPLDRVTIDALMEFQAIARRIVNREPDDATREGFEIKGKYTPEQIKAIEKSISGRREGGGSLAGLDLLNSAGDARRWARGYGGGAIMMHADDGQPPWLPINFPTLRRLRGLTVLDRFEIYPDRWDTDPYSPRAGDPITYRFATSGGGGVSAMGRVHWSRVVIAQGVKLPRRRLVARDGWGGSKLDQVWQELSAYCSSNQFAAEAISLLNQGVLTIEGLAESIEADDIDAVVDRLEAIRLSMGMLGDIALDPGESYSIHERTLTGLSDALEALKSALLAATDEPKTILFGEQPSGLNATADAETRGWYDHVGAQQSQEYTPLVVPVLEVLCRSAEGPTGGVWDPDTAIEWRPLWQMSEDERASIRLRNAQARALDAAAGAVSKAELRRDPELVEIYKIDPNEPPPEPAAAPGAATPPIDGEDDGDPLGSVIVPADESEVRPGEAMLTAADVSRAIGRSATSIRRMAALGAVPAWRDPGSGHWRFQLSSVLEAYQEGYNRRGDARPLP